MDHQPGGACEDGCGLSCGFNLRRVVEAACSGETDAIVQLLSVGTVPNQASSQALLYAAGSGHVSTVRALVLSCGADVNYVSDVGWTATMHAARNGRTECVVVLVKEFGARVQFASPAGRTALMYAASHGHIDAVLALLDCGADAMHADTRNWNASMYAVALGHTSIAHAVEQYCSRTSKRKPVETKDSVAASIPDLASHARQGTVALPSTTPDALEQSLSQRLRPKHRSGVRIISSHLPKKVSTRLSLDAMPPGPCASGGGLWTIVETSTPYGSPSC